MTTFEMLNIIYIDISRSNKDDHILSINNLWNNNSEDIDCNSNNQILTDNFELFRRNKHQKLFEIQKNFL